MAARCLDEHAIASRAGRLAGDEVLTCMSPDSWTKGSRIRQVLASRSLNDFGNAEVMATSVLAVEQRGCDPYFVSNTDLSN